MYKKYLSFFTVIFAVLLFMGQGCLSVDGKNQKTEGPVGMFVSTKQGDGWTEINSLPTVEGVESLKTINVYRLAEDPQDPDTLYWASRAQGLFYSYDNGKTWQHAVGALSSGFIRSIAVHPQEKCVIFVANGRQIFKTNDCARSFELMYEEVRVEDSITSLAVDPFGSHDLYMSLSNGDVLISKNEGKTWSIVKRFDTYVSDIAFDMHREGALYIATYEKGLHRSFDRGKTWTDLSSKLEEFSGALTFRRMLVYPSQENYIYWVSEYGILVSRNAGEEWEAVNLLTPPGTVDIYGFAVNPKDNKELYYTGTIDMVRSNFYRSQDGGATWETRKLPSGQIPTQLRIHPENTDWIYMGFTIPPKS